MHFIDTNVLLYSISPEHAERDKRDRAIEILEQDDGALSVQVQQEFYVQATRPTGAARLAHELAVGFIGEWRQRFAVQETTLGVFDDALAIKLAHRLSFWDSAIIAAARALGCRRLYSEHLAHGREIEGVRVINPFR